MPPTAPLDTIYTADEAAERLRVTRRHIIKLGRKFGTCSRIGTEYLFSEEDLLRLWAAVRVEPPANSRSTTARSFPTDTWFKEDIDWIFSRPPTGVDRRLMGVLKQLNEAGEAKSHKGLNGAAQRTIDILLERGLVLSCGTDANGLTLVQISANGLEQIKVAERWAKKRRAHGKSDRWW
jgi:hypothetical protein